jgi:hypothetical protein
VPRSAAPRILETLAAAIQTLDRRQGGRPAPDRARHRRYAPGRDDATTMGAFFAEHGERVQSFVQSEFRGVPRDARRSGGAARRSAPVEALEEVRLPPATARGSNATSSSRSSCRSTRPRSSIRRRSSPRTSRSRRSWRRLGEAGGADRPRGGSVRPCRPPEDFRRRLRHARQGDRLRAQPVGGAVASPA